MNFILFFPLLVFSVILHEVAHGLLALREGDDTALRSGRLTLNPLAHLDPIGSVLFPLVCFFMNLPLFGWAKPVPINPLRFHHYKSGTVKVSLAGPLTNFILAVLLVTLFIVLAKWTSMLIQYPFLPSFISQGVLLNLVLAVFNLLPIPPLDGSRIVSVLLPTEMAYKYNAIEPYGFFILMALIGFGFLGKILYPIVTALYQILFRVAGY